MNMNQRLHILKTGLLACFLALTALAAPAASARQKAKAAKNATVTLHVEITDPSHKPVEDAVVYSSKNRYGYEADALGRATFTVPTDDNLKVMAPGYEEILLTPADVRDGQGKITLLPALAYTGAHHQVALPFRQLDARRNVGAWSTVSGEEMEKAPSSFLYHALGGRLAGLFTQDSNSEPSNLGASHYTRTNQGAFLVLIDGVERTVEFLEPEMIESVQLLKDAASKALYAGGRNIGSILMITTKRGARFENKVTVNAQSGIMTPSGLPQYLDSYEYAQYYNQACANSGVDPQYDPANYRGEDPVLYPNVDFYNEFLKKQMNTTRASMQVTGGSKNTAYFAHLGYQNQGGLEKYTSYPTSNNVLSFRANVDNTLFDFLTIRAGFNASVEKYSRYNVDVATLFEEFSTRRPNEYPLYIPGSRLGLEETDFVLGGTSQYRNNPYGLLTRRGNRERGNNYIQSDFSIEADFNKWIKGLSAKALVSFDSYNTILATQGGTFMVYDVKGNAEGGLDYVTWNQDSKNTSQSLSDNSTQRNYLGNASLNYNRDWDKHSLRAVANFFIQNKELSNNYQPIRRLSYGVAANYMYNNRYVVDVAANVTGVSTFDPNSRYGLSPTVGAAWIMSEENFLQNASWLDFLKLKASYGVLKSTTMSGDLYSAYLYQDRWAAGSAYGSGAYNTVVSQSFTGNPDLTFQKTREMNAGFEAELFRHRLWIYAGYYDAYLSGAFADLSTITPGVTGKGGALMTQNYKEDRSYGAEMEFVFKQNWNGFKLTLGGNATYGIRKNVKDAEFDYGPGFEGLNKVDVVGDIRGLEVIGTYTSEEDIANSPRPVFGVVNVGDFKYRDTNGDRVIDNKDRVIVGNSQPSLAYGINLNLAWKGLSLSVVGYGLAGFQQTLSDQYFRPYAARKYSVVVKNGLPNGKPLPPLMIDYAPNNYQTSDWWIMNGGYFKIRNAELAYTLPHKCTKSFGVNSLKVFARGYNLCSFSGFDELDPEAITAGMTGYPLCTTLTGGLTLSF